MTLMTTMLPSLSWAQFYGNGQGTAQPPIYNKARLPKAPSSIVPRLDQEPTNATFIMVGGGIGLPGGDLAKRYGLHGEANLGVMFKTKTNWLYALELGYMFGEDVKESTLGSLVTQDGAVIGNVGRYAVVSVQQRAIKLPILKVGKLFKTVTPSWMDQQSSGPFMMVGAGFFQHQMAFNVTSELQFLQGTGSRGYDRMCNGLALVQQAGYMMTHRSRWYGAYIAVETMQGFTKSQRFDYDLRSLNDQSRLDLTFNLKLGLILPIFPASDNELLFD